MFPIFASDWPFLPPSVRVIYGSLTSPSTIQFEIKTPHWRLSNTVGGASAEERKHSGSPPLTPAEIWPGLMLALAGSVVITLQTGEMVHHAS